MSHANAALTPRARLRLARLIVDQGWPVARAAERYDVSWPTAKRWADRYRQLGPAGMGDRIAHARTTARTGPRSRWSARSCTCGGSSGWDRSRSRDRVGCRPRRCTRCWSAAGSTGSPTSTGSPVSRSAATSTPYPGSLLHVDVKKLGNVPDGGGWRYVGRAQGDRNRHRHAGSRDEERYHRQGGHRVRAHRHRRPLPRRLRRDPRRRDRRHRHRRAAPRRGLVRRPRRHRRAGAVRQRQRLRSPTCGATPAPSWASHRRGPGPTGPRPTARSNASTAPWPTAGPSRGSTTPRPPAEPPCQHGSTSTTTTGPTPRSAGHAHHPLDQPAWSVHLAGWLVEDEPLQPGLSRYSGGAGHTPYPGGCAAYGYPVAGGGRRADRANPGPWSPFSSWLVGQTEADRHCRL